MKYGEKDRTGCHSNHLTLKVTFRVTKFINCLYNWLIIAGQNA